MAVHAPVCDQKVPVFEWECLIGAMFNKAPRESHRDASLCPAVCRREVVAQVVGAVGEGAQMRGAVSHEHATRVVVDVEPKFSWRGT